MCSLSAETSRRRVFGRARTAGRAQRDVWLSLKTENSRASGEGARLNPSWASQGPTWAAASGTYATGRCVVNLRRAKRVGARSERCHFLWRVVVRSLDFTEFGVLGGGRGTSFEEDPAPAIPLHMGTLSKACQHEASRA